MLRIGLTGGIGSGKSIVSQVLKMLGVPVYNADSEAKRFYLDKDVRGRILSTFGTTDLKEIASQVFGSAERLQQLNAIIHPKVMSDFNDWVDRWTDRAQFVVMESAIIFEHNLEKYFDKIVTVEAPEELRLQRVMLRDNVTAEEVRKRMAAQMSDVERKGRADFVIINDNIQPLLPQVKAAFKR
jgi:dephospho-CoA kinase